MIKIKMMKISKTEMMINKINKIKIKMKTSMMKSMPHHKKLSNQTSLNKVDSLINNKEVNHKEINPSIIRAENQTIKEENHIIKVENHNIMEDSKIEEIEEIEVIVTIEEEIEEVEEEIEVEEGVEEDSKEEIETLIITEVDIKVATETSITTEVDSTKAEMEENLSTKNIDLIVFI